jgi:hypothetical protein
MYSTVNRIFYILIRIKCNRISEGLPYLFQTSSFLFSIIQSTITIKLLNCWKYNNIKYVQKFTSKSILLISDYPNKPIIGIWCVHYFRTPCRILSLRVTFPLTKYRVPDSRQRQGICLFSPQRPDRLPPSLVYYGYCEPTTVMQLQREADH